MDNQQHQKHVHTPGLDGSHGVHVCHKCGWPFPNPHPSAKHRRAHKRICGTIEGYKILDLEGSTYSNVSDEDHLSDEDHNTPSPKVLKASSHEKGRGGTRDLPNRSEEEVFSDAAAEFSDGGFGSGTQERQVDAGKSAIVAEKIVKIESNTVQSSEGGPIAEIIKPLGSATDGFQIQHSETPDSTSNGSGNAPEVIGTYKNALVDNLHTMKSETRKDVLEESEKTSAIDDIVDGSLTLPGKGTDVDERKEKYVESNLPDVTISLIKVDGELQEKHTDGFLLKIPESDVSTEVESVECVNASDNTAETMVESAKGISYKNLGDLIEKGEANANLHVLSVPDDIHVVDNPEKMLEDFKDHKVMNLDQSATLEPEQANDKEDDTNGPVVEGSGLDLRSNQGEDNQGEDTVVFVSDRHVLEDSVQLDQGRSVPTVKDVPVEEEADLSQIKVQSTDNQKSDEIGTSSDVVMPLMDKSFSVSSPEGQESYDVCSKTLQDSFSQYAKTAVSDVDSVVALGNAGIAQATHLVGVDDHARAENSDLSEDYDHSKGAREDDYTVSPVTATEFASNGSNIKVNSATNLPEGDDTSYEKVELAKDDLTGDAGCNETAPLVKDKTGVNNNNGPAKESFSEHPVATAESAEMLSESQINLEKTNLQKGDDAGNDEKFEIQDYIAGDACAAAAGLVEDETGIGNSEARTKESSSEHAVVTPESANKSSVPYVNPAADLQEVSDTNDGEKDRIEKCVEHGIESKEVTVEEKLPKQQETSPDPASYLQESNTVAKDVVFESLEKSPDIGFTDLGSAPDSSGVGVIVTSDIQQGMTEHEIDGNDKEQVNEDNNVKEPTTVSPLHAKSSIQSSTAVEDNSTREFDVTSGAGSESFQVGSDRQQLGGSAIDLSVDSISQSDSLEGNWGSVSVLSTQSDAQAVIDAETLSPTESQVVTGEKTNSNQSKPASEGQHPDKSDMYEPPSFMTLVEPGGGKDQTATSSEIQTGQVSQQPKSSSLQAAWFPSITHIANESQGRKKNEEIISKVTNWSTGKQHTPLKSLLGEASLETRAKSPKRKENVAPDLQKGDKAAATTVNSILAPESPLGQAANREIGKEWNSPARYPTEIKREKRKSRPYWAQFVCCSSSVH